MCQCWFLTLPNATQCTAVHCNGMQEWMEFLCKNFKNVLTFICTCAVAPSSYVFTCLLLELRWANCRCNCVYHHSCSRVISLLKLWALLQRSRRFPQAVTACKPAIALCHWFRRTHIISAAVIGCGSLQPCRKNRNTFHFSAANLLSVMQELCYVTKACIALHYIMMEVSS